MVMTAQESYVLEAMGWHITAGHSDWLQSGESLAGRADVRLAYEALDRKLRPDALYRVIGLMHHDSSHTEYTPVEGGRGVRLLVSGDGLKVEEFEVCVADEVAFGLVGGCDCTRCGDDAGPVRRAADPS
uniref:Uncharacterized protein n=3 Tax=Pseudonocardiaceae TaxID=2070 RepID=A0A2W4JDF7_9PSEU|nr:MAG: hypothetical protein DIU77_10690 [Thermocrispum agreste]